MKHLSGALLALTVTPMAIVLALPSSASAASPATCAGTDTALTASGARAPSVRRSAAPKSKGATGSGHLVLSDSSHHRVCVSTAMPSLAAGSGKDTNYPGTLKGHLRAGTSEELAAEAGSDTGFGDPSGEAPEVPETGGDRELSSPPGGARSPAAPGCAVALAAEPDSIGASPGPNPARQETADNAAAPCESGRSLLAPDSGHAARTDPAGHGTGSAKSGSGTTAASAFTFGLGATGGGLLLMGGSMRRSRRAS